MHQRRRLSRAIGRSGSEQRAAAGRAQRPIGPAHQAHANGLHRPLCMHPQVVCTLGPKSRDVPVLEELLRAGMSVARFNFSHGSHEYHQVCVLAPLAPRAPFERPTAPHRNGDCVKHAMGVKEGCC